jgi:hypothetical protein
MGVLEDLELQVNEKKPEGSPELFQLYYSMPADLY